MSSNPDPAPTQQPTSDLPQQTSADAASSTDTPITIAKVETVSVTDTTQLNIAIIGCVHGELDKLYKACEEYHIQSKKRVHVVICCGDFESMRNLDDLQCLACPPKYRNMVDFYNYYNGKKTAPILTIFTHGNHEASNYLMELPYGGWVAPNIYFMGFTNVINLFGITLSAIGGILKHHHYHQGRSETCPLNESTMKSLYHTREVDTWMLQQYSKPVDVLFSHDWPHMAATKGDLKRLLELKPDFAQDVANNQLGSPYHTFLLNKLRPLFWFSAHLHVKYPALFVHSDDKNNLQPLPNQTPTNEKSLAQFSIKTPSTKFLALDKIVPGRSFMHVFQHDIGPNSTSPTISSTDSPPALLATVLNHFKYDPHWVQILQLSQPFYPRLPETRLSSRIRKPMQYAPEFHKDFYKQYDGVCCHCITNSSSREDLFVNDCAAFQAQLYPKPPPSATASNDPMIIPQHTFAHTASPLLVEQPRPVYDARRRGDRPQVIGTGSMPGFTLNPQTILLCNQFQLLVPVFFPNVHWCSPKHASELFQSGQKPKQ